MELFHRWKTQETTSCTLPTEDPVTASGTCCSISEEEEDGPGHLLPMAAQHTEKHAQNYRPSCGKRDASSGLPRPPAFVTWPLLGTTRHLAHGI